MKRVWMVVAFGDIRGFQAWSSRAGTTNEIRNPFMRKFYEIIGQYARAKDWHLKYLGDGFMALFEMPIMSEKSSHTLKFVYEIRYLTQKLAQLVKECEYPAPDGFRTRLACGYVDRASVLDPFVKNNRVYEYNGYLVNLASFLLDVQPEIPLICTEGILKAIGQKKITSLKVKKVDEKLTSLASLISADPQDISSLWEIDITERRHGQRN